MTLAASFLETQASATREASLTGVVPVVAGLVVLAALAALPFVLPGYRTFQITQAAIYAIVLLGLNILVGFNGQLSLGHSAFYCVGAYTAAILMERLGVPYWATVPIAGGVAFGSGFLFGLPALRLQGHHLALATFALAVATPQLLKHKALAGWTGGAQGMVLTKPEPPSWLAVNADQWLYLFTLAIGIAMFVIGRNLVRGRTGRALEALRDHPVAAEAMGINAALYKSAAFGVSALYAGVGGALSATVVSFVAPDSFQPLLSMTFLIGLVVGGIASVSGALWGALFIQFVPNLADDMSKAIPGAIFGVALLACVYAMPYGFAGLLRTLGHRLRRR
jgi:branched-chain amino acid transport system permease protein